MNVACQPTFHRHTLRCAKCGVIDDTVYQVIRLDGSRWDPLCTPCATKARRIRAIERAVAS